MKPNYSFLMKWPLTYDTHLRNMKELRQKEKEKEKGEHIGQQTP